MSRHPLPSAAQAAEVRPDPDGDPLRDVVRLLGGDVAAMQSVAHIPVALRRVEEGSLLTHEGAPLQSLYVVRCGSLKCVRTLEDGYEQVTALALPGDVLGFEGLHTGCHAATDIALELSTVYALPLTSLNSLRKQCPMVDDAWQRALSRQLAQAAATADMLAAVASEVRLARFVLHLSTRAKAIGWSPRRLRLGMCRRDIASLLGVAHETVSRSFTTMVEAGLLKVSNREVEILDFAQLQTRARSTRRPAAPSAIEAPAAARSAPRPWQAASTRWSALEPAAATL